MFKPTLTADEAARIEHATRLQDRADRIVLKLESEVDAGRKGLIVFASDEEESAALTELLIEHYGPQSDGNAFNLEMLSGGKPDPDRKVHVRRTSRRGCMFLPRIYDTPNFIPDPRFALGIRESLGRPSILPGSVIMVLESSRAQFMRQREAA